MSQLTGLLKLNKSIRFRLKWKYRAGKNIYSIV
jgi:hypothetical protein